MPRPLQDHLDEIENWALANLSDARTDAVLFWVLKGTAILVSAAAGVLAVGKRRQMLKVAAGPVASVLILADGFFAPGNLRSVHYLAYSELRALQQDMVSKWRSGILESKNPNELAASILKDARPVEKRIEEYLRTAEAGLKDQKNEPSRKE